MAYRRRQGISRASTFKEELLHPSSLDVVKDSDHDNSSPSIFSSSSSSTPSSSSLAAQAIKASSSHRQPSLSFAFAPDSDPDPGRQRSKSFEAYRNDNSKSGFWGVIAQKAKSMLDDDKSTPQPQHDTMHPLHHTLKSNSFDTVTDPSAAQDLQVKDVRT